MLRTASRLVCLAGAVAAATAGAVALRADLLIGFGFDKALATRTGEPFQVADHATSRAASAKVGDEAYWLRAGDTIARPVVMRGRPVEGERIVYAPNGDGRAVILEVVSVNFVGTPIVDEADGSSAVRLMRVTFRVLHPHRADTGKDELLHLWFQTHPLVHRTPSQT